jgi:hypothetical protein
VRSTKHFVRYRTEFYLDRAMVNADQSAAGVTERGAHECGGGTDVMRWLHYGRGLCR